MPNNVFFSGVDVTANQEEISNHETFQLEFDPKAAKWAIRTMQDKYFRWELLDIYNINNSKQYYKQQYYAPIPKKCSPKFFSSLQAGGGLQAGESRRANAALLDLTWLEDGAVAFKADNGKFVGTKKSGHLFANVDTVEERSKYVKH